MSEEKPCKRLSHTVEMPFPVRCVICDWPFFAYRAQQVPEARVSCPRCGVSLERAALFQEKPEFNEIDRMNGVLAAWNTICEFFSFLDQQKYSLFELEDNGNKGHRKRWHRLRGAKVEELLFKYLKIDPVRLEAERRKLLQQFRRPVE